MNKFLASSKRFRMNKHRILLFSTWVVTALKQVFLKKFLLYRYWKKIRVERKLLIKPFRQFRKRFYKWKLSNIQKFKIQQNYFKRYQLKNLFKKYTNVSNYLEHRVAQIVFETNFCLSINQIRQFFFHGFFQLNNSKVTTLNKKCLSGDVITIKLCFQLLFLKNLLDLCIIELRTQKSVRRRKRERLRRKIRQIFWQEEHVCLPSKTFFKRKRSFIKNEYWKLKKNLKKKQENKLFLKKGLLNLKKLEKNITFSRSNTKIVPFTKKEKEFLFDEIEQYDFDVLYYFKKKIYNCSAFNHFFKIKKILNKFISNNYKEQKFNKIATGSKCYRSYLGLNWKSCQFYYFSILKKKAAKKHHNEQKLLKKKYKIKIKKVELKKTKYCAEILNFTKQEQTYLLKELELQLKNVLVYKSYNLNANSIKNKCFKYYKKLRFNKIRYNPTQRANCRHRWYKRVCGRFSKISNKAICFCSKNINSLQIKGNVLKNKIKKQYEKIFTSFFMGGNLLKKKTFQKKLLFEKKNNNLDFIEIRGDFFKKTKKSNNIKKNLKKFRSIKSKGIFLKLNLYNFFLKFMFRFHMSSPFYWNSHAIIENEVNLITKWNFFLGPIENWVINWTIKMKENFTYFYFFNIFQFDFLFFTGSLLKKKLSSLFQNNWVLKKNMDSKWKKLIDLKTNLTFFYIISFKNIKIQKKQRNFYIKIRKTKKIDSCDKMKFWKKKPLAPVFKFFLRGSRELLSFIFRSNRSFSNYLEIISNYIELDFYENWYFHNFIFLVGLMKFSRFYRKTFYSILNKKIFFYIKFWQKYKKKDFCSSFKTFLKKKKVSYFSNSHYDLNLKSKLIRLNKKNKKKDLILKTNLKSFLDVKLQKSNWALKWRIFLVSRLKKSRRQWNWNWIFKPRIRIRKKRIQPQKVKSIQLYWLKKFDITFNLFKRFFFWKFFIKKYLFKKWRFWRFKKKKYKWWWGLLSKYRVKKINLSSKNLEINYKTFSIVVL